MLLGTSKIAHFGRRSSGFLLQSDRVMRFEIEETTFSMESTAFTRPAAFLATSTLEDGPDTETNPRAQFGAYLGVWPGVTGLEELAGGYNA